LKNKSVVTVAEALKKILKDRKPENLRVDEGKEFYDKNVKKCILQKTKTKALMLTDGLELWMKKMFKYFTANNTTKNYILGDDYNNTYHSIIKMTLIEASKKADVEIGRQNL
jgi:hypothetical protein